MRAYLTRRKLYNTIQDLIIIKAGLYLNESEISELIKDIKDSSTAINLIDGKNMSDVICVRPEEVEYLVNKIRYKIGNIDNENNYPSHEFFMKNIDSGQDLKKMVASFGKLLKEVKNKSIDQEFVNNLSKSANVPYDFAAEFIRAIARDNDLSIGYRVPSKEWDNVVNLNDLFKSENLPNKPNVFFDQRYIDYLCRQIDDLDKINWRQFEGLTAEFFNREGFQVNIGKGRKDGGIDVTLYGKNNELIIVQCKRYNKNRTVKVEQVKALYWDIMKNKASSALLATTSYLAPDGKKICDVKEYQINAAEYDNIVNWLNKMKSNNIN